MANKKELSIAVLAGGKSSRMGRDKGLVVFRGKKMIEQVLKVAAAISSDILIIANSEAYRQFSYPCFEDEIKDCGPMGAIFTALQQAKADKVLVLSCDVPLISASVLQQLAKNCGEESALVASHDGQIQPLCGIYDKKCIGFFKETIGLGNFQMKALLAEMDAKTMAFEGEAYNQAFLNINTPEDLAQIQKMYDEK